MSNLFDTVSGNTVFTQYDFTQKAIHDFNLFIKSEDFSSPENASRINSFLLGTALNVSFGRHLQRYLCDHHDFGMPRNSVTVKEMTNYIRTCYSRNAAPASPAPSPRNVRNWLTQRSARRATVFSLGFGLKMNEKEVDQFLSKVIGESSFNNTDLTETVYQYCYAHGYGYDRAVFLLTNYRRIGLTREELAGKLPPDFRIGQMETDEELCRYLRFLGEKGFYASGQRRAHSNYEQLIVRIRQVISDTYNADYERDESFKGHFSLLHRQKEKKYKPENISNYDIEQALYNATPLDNKGNLQKLLSSNLKDAFRGYRLSRQRMNNIELRKQAVERFDLLTLLFYLYARTYEESDPIDRCRRFVDHANALLPASGMMRLYVANSYEAFLLLCLLDEFPLNCFSEVWEVSYGIDPE